MVPASGRMAERLVFIVWEMLVPCCRLCRVGAGAFHIVLVYYGYSGMASDLARESTHFVL